LISATATGVTWPAAAQLSRGAHQRTGAALNCRLRSA